MPQKNQLLTGTTAERSFQALGGLSFLGQLTKLSDAVQAYAILSGMGRLYAASLASLTIGATGDPEATTNQKYIRQGASGTGSGNDWTNAYTDIPADLDRDTTYWMADGAYTGHTFDEANSGTQVIRVKKATVGLHGTNTGWSDTYGDGQATWSGACNLVTDYITIDGSTRNESNWKQGSAYGFRIGGITSDSIAFGNASDHIKIRYCDLGGTYSETWYVGMPSDCIKVAYAQTDWIVQRCWLHNCVGTMVQFAGVDSGLMEYCFFGPSWGKVAFRGQVSTTNTVLRHNFFFNSAQVEGIGGDSSSGLTAEIAMWDGTAWDNNEVYGNVFYSTVTGNRNSAVLIGGNGTTWVGSGGANTKVHNNTFAGMVEASVFPMILLNGSNTEAKNNLFWDTVDADVSATSTSNNVDATINPFVDYGALDFRINSGSQAHNAGVDVGDAPYNVDRDGTSREGHWSVGAYEFAG